MTSLLTVLYQNSAALLRNSATLGVMLRRVMTSLKQLTNEGDHLTGTGLGFEQQLFDLHWLIEPEKIKKCSETISQSTKDGRVAAA